MYRNAGDPFMWGVRDTENHRIIVAIWKQYPALLAWTLDLKAIVKKNEQLTGKAHAEHGYRFLEFFSMQAGEKKAEGFLLPPGFFFTLIGKSFTLLFIS